VRKYINVWDSCSLEELSQTRSLRLFGNANVGNLLFTNLQVPGMLTYQGEAALTNMYVRSDLYEPALGEATAVIQDALIEGRTSEAMTLLVAGLSMADVELLRAFRAWAHRAMCTFILGDRVMSTMDVATLASPARRMLYQMEQPTVWTVPNRQHVNVNLETYGSSIDELVLAASRSPRLAPRIWVHLEGTIEMAVQ